MEKPSFPTLAPEERIVILSGSGISQESGLHTFRDADGIWAQVRLDDVATPEGFARDRPRVHEFHNRLRRRLHDPEIQPNAAHKALALLERDWPGQVLVITQNVDDLHERAGTRELIHMHGELFKTRCEHCGFVNHWHEDLTVEEYCISCSQSGGMRPHVVWFGEMPFDMNRINAALADCGLFISIGTSGQIYPAAGFVHEARFRGRAHTVELNLEPSEGTSLFAETIHGRASEVVPAYVDRLLRRARRAAG